MNAPLPNTLAPELPAAERTPAPPTPPAPDLELGFDNPRLPPLHALPGEHGIPDVTQATRSTWSRKGLLALGLILLLIVAVIAFTVQRMGLAGKRDGEAQPKRVGQQPMAATTEIKKLDLSAAPAPAARSASDVALLANAAAGTRIPALLPQADEGVEPIGVRRTGQTGTSTGTQRAYSPDDASVMIVSARPGATLTSARGAAAPGSGDGQTDVPFDPNAPLAATQHNLDQYQVQLQGLMNTLSRTADAATGKSGSGAGLSTGLAQATGPASPLGQAAGLFGGQLQGSATPRAQASVMPKRSLTLPKGTSFTCALKTKIVSAASGMVGCLVQRNVYSDDGRVLLVERGSHLDGEYRIASVRPGTVRIPVIWTRLRTPLGVVIDLESPGTGPLGESGVDGFVDNRWGERIGAAMLLSLIDDSVKLVVQHQTSDSTGSANTVVLPSTTANTSKLAEKVLDSTINIPPLIYQNQGGIVGIYVARDLDFSAVYSLRPTAR